MNDSSDSGSSTARRAAAMLEARNEGFVVPTGKQRRNLPVAFAKREKVVYGKSFDIVRLSAQVDLDNLADVAPEQRSRLRRQDA